MNIPTLETERLVLRAPVLADFPAHFALWTHPRTTLHFGGITFDEEELWQRFLRNIGQWQLFGYGNWGVVEKESTRYIGSMGFFQSRRPLDIPVRTAPEAGWALHADWHGRGLAREAMAAAMGWADVHIDAPQSWCMINPGNDISRKVAERLGYRPGETVAYKDHPVTIFTRPRGGTP